MHILLCYTRVQVTHNIILILYTFYITHIFLSHTFYTFLAYFRYSIEQCHRTLQRVKIIGHCLTTILKMWLEYREWADLLTFAIQTI